MNIILVTQNEIMKKQIENNIRKEYEDKGFEIKLYIFDNINKAILHHFRKKNNHIAVIDIDNEIDLKIIYKIKLISNNIYMIYYNENNKNLKFDKVEPYRVPHSIEETVDAVMYAVKRCLKIVYQLFHFYKDGVMMEIPFDDILYFRSDKRIIRIICLNGKEEYFYDKLDKVEEHMYLQKSFIRVNYSYFVNMKYVIEQSGKTLTMCDGTCISITRKNVIGKFWEA